MARAPSRARPRPAILQVAGYEDVAAPADDTPAAFDPDADKDPFYVADQRAEVAPPAAEPAAADPSGTINELPLPDSTAPPVAGATEPAGELPLPDSSLPPESIGELPLPDSSQTPAAPASQVPLPEADDAQPLPLEQLEEQLFPDEVPEMDDEDEFSLPPGDLSQGIDTGPGGVGCKGYDKQCREALEELQKRDITSVVVGVVIEGTEGEDFPCDCRLGRDFDAADYVPRDFSPTLFTWKASGLCHKPLYFEDVQLERYGHSWNPIVQPFFSGAHFFVSVPLLPYKMGLKPPHECVYTLGYYRPGNCAPYMIEPIPLSLRAAVWEGFGAAAFTFWFWPPN